MVFLLQELMGLLVHSPTVSFSSFYQVSFTTKLSFSACSVQQRATIAIHQHCVDFKHAHERTGALFDSVNCRNHVYHANNIQHSSRDKDTIAERNTTDRGDSYSSKLAELSPGPALLGERQQSESAQSETTARSRLASEIEWLKSREAAEDGTSFYPDDDYYDNDDKFYSESLDSFVKFRYSVIS
jgi:hypothetical protein